MLEHAIAAVGGDDGQCRLAGVSDVVEMRKTHCSWVKRRDLVVVEICGDEGLGGETALDLTHVGAWQIQCVETAQIGFGVLANRRHDQRIALQQFEVVSNVAGAPAEFSAHFRN